MSDEQEQYDLAGALEKELDRMDGKSDEEIENSGVPAEEAEDASEEATETTEAKGEVDDTEPSDEEATESDGEPTGEEAQAVGEEGGGPADEASDETAEADDTPPEGLTERSRKRWDKLLTERNEARERIGTAEKEVEEIKGAAQQLFGLMQESGLSTDDLTAIFEFHRNARLGNVNEAKTFWDQYAGMVSQQFGFGAPTGGEINPLLTQYDDLNQAVENMEITEEKAIELAQYRRAREIQEQQQQAGMQHQTQEQETRQLVSDGANAMKEWEAEKLRTDPDYKAMQGSVARFAKSIMSQVHPSAWMTTIENFYNEQKAQIEAQAEQRRRQNPAGVRPQGTTTAGGAKPKTMQEAMANELNAMRGG